MDKISFEEYGLGFKIPFRIFQDRSMRRIAMPNVEVNCAVSNCIFHKKGNLCGAEKIQIDMDYHSKNKNTEFATDFDFKAISEEASDSTETCCKTFKSKK